VSRSSSSDVPTYDLDDDLHGPQASIDPPRNFTVSTEERIRALSIGAPAYAVRKREIEDQERAWLKALRDMRRTLETKSASAERIERALAEKAASFDYTRQNARIAAHNRWYPIEANLRMDPRTGGYLVFGRPWEEEPPCSAERLLAILQMIR